MKSLVSPDDVHGERLLHGGPPPGGCGVVVFDFDGVLAETSGGEVRQRPLGVVLARRLIGRGYRVYIVSGRPDREEGLIKRLLREWCIPLAGVRGILLRRSGVGEVDHKLESIMQIEAREGCVGEVHDDNPYVLEALRRRAETLVLHTPQGCEVLKGRPAEPCTLDAGWLRWEGRTPQC
ncbi:hypothetical protein [Aeropyrum camini]|uniref:Phosphatase n=1 Tax=Aeropyrum camini SY1 = JCM 12091 TaxID=1198449 RepID=U3TD23_9CREN|nr:hypothetical protein [Aeropyrum camini]BAN89930.1 hypothetical protein ACAM_0461 [Aeropyrum camini SY1 = JCM 12091]